VIRVVFYCPGTTEKPSHICTREANASLDDFLRSGPDLAATGGGGPAPEAALDISTQAARADAAEQLDTYSLDRLRQRISGKNFRITVDCETCKTVSILADELINEAEPAPRARHVDIHLLAQGPSDKALLEAGKAVIGLSTLKSATTNAAFVTANLALITTLVTTLGLVKTDAIDTTLASSDKQWLLIAAAISGVLALILALGAQIVTFQKVHAANLEEVREYLNQEIAWRSTMSALSVIFLGIAAVSVAAAFIWVLTEKESASPSGSLTVTVNGATLGVGIDSSWNDAPKKSQMRVTVTSGAEVPVNVNKDTKDGSASVQTSFSASRPSTPSKKSSFTITSKLVTAQGSDVTGASKKQCVTVPASGAPSSATC
jgi:hypothetical protein